MIKVEGLGGIKATIVADSISTNRITTFELEYPRFIHSEIMTHRLFSRNAASSRAIPVAAMIEQVKTAPAMPIHWGANQPGMQAERECNNQVGGFYSDGMGIRVGKLESGGMPREVAWQVAANKAAEMAKSFADAGYHKQIVNRLLEPFQMMKTVVTATEWDNFFHLRLHPDAQPEIAELARVMYKALEESTPEELCAGEWHVPYVRTLRMSDGMRVYCKTYSERWDEKYQQVERTWTEMSLEDALKVSASCCAMVSYRKTDSRLEKAIQIYEKLIGSAPKHWSPFEHQATPMRYSKHERFPEMVMEYGALEDGVTHCDRHGLLWSGNFCGWVQQRQFLGGWDVDKG